MITLKHLSDWAQTSQVKLFLLNDSKEQADTVQSLPKDEYSKFSALNLKPGKLESLNVMADGQVATSLYGLLPGELTYDALEELTAELEKTLRALRAGDVDILLADGALVDWSGVLYKRLLLMGHDFDCYQTSGVAALELDSEAPDKEMFEPHFTVYLPEEFNLTAEEAKLGTATKIAEGILTARRLVNEPANVMSPELLAQEAGKLAQQHGFEIEVFDEKQIQELGLQAFWSVAKGSDAPPRFLVMRYMNNPDNEELLALVGKGLTYDSGGYAIKPPAGMETMFSDMSGAAAVIGAISVLASMQAKVNVVAVVAACENMISGRAVRNGDIIGSLAGKFIEVVNTDAEGRLTLADAISYAATVLKADKIIDIATLTGAVSIALGHEISGVVADDEEIWQALVKASESSGDKIWRLPHYDHLAKHNKSDRADLKNSGGRPASSATAALFCRAFAFGKPWGHLDIAGTAYQKKASAKAPLGATGVGVELLTLAALTLFKQ